MVRYGEFASGAIMYSRGFLNNGTCNNYVDAK